MRIALGFAAVACVTTVLLSQGRVNPTDPQPTCNMCPGTYIPAFRAWRLHEESDRREADRPANAGYRHR